jgi:hypothetical protein
MAAALSPLKLLTSTKTPSILVDAWLDKDGVRRSNPAAGSFQTRCENRPVLGTRTLTFIWDCARSVRNSGGVEADRSTPAP